MLTSLVLHLKSPTKASLPATLGRAGQALLLELVSKQDAAVAQAMHQGDGPKPYTVSNLLLGKRQKDSVLIEAGQEGWLRFTGLTAAVSRQLQALALEPPETVRLARVAPFPSPNMPPPCPLPARSFRRSSQQCVVGSFLHVPEPVLRQPEAGGPSPGGPGSRVPPPRQGDHTPGG